MLGIPRPAPVEIDDEFRNSILANSNMFEVFQKLLTLTSKQWHQFFEPMSAAARITWLMSVLKRRLGGPYDSDRFLAYSRSQVAVYERMLTPSSSSPPLIDLNTPELGTNFLTWVLPYALYHGPLDDYFNLGYRNLTVTLRDVALTKTAAIDFSLIAIKKVIDCSSGRGIAEPLLKCVPISPQAMTALAGAVAEELVNRVKYRNPSAFTEFSELQATCLKELQKRRVLHQEACAKVIADLEEKSGKACGVKVVAETKAVPATTKWSVPSPASPPAAAVAINLDDEKLEFSRIDPSTLLDKIATTLTAECKATDSAAEPFKQTALWVEKLKTQRCWHVFWMRDSDNVHLLSHLVSAYAKASSAHKEVLLKIIRSCLEVAAVTQINHTPLPGRLNRNREDKLVQLFNDMRHQADLFDYSLGYFTAAPTSLLEIIGHEFFQHVRVDRIDQALHVLHAGIKLTASAMTSLMHARMAEKLLAMIEDAGRLKAKEAGIEYIDTGDVYAHIGLVVKSQCYCDYLKPYDTQYLHSPTRLRCDAFDTDAYEADGIAGLLSSPTGTFPASPSMVGAAAPIRMDAAAAAPSSGIPRSVSFAIVPKRSNS